MQKTHTTLLIAGAVALASLMATTAYADGVPVPDPEPVPQRDLIGEITGNQHIQLALFVVVVGVALRTWSGMIGKKAKEVNANHVAFTFIIAMLTSFHIVLITLQEIPQTASAEAWAGAIGLGILGVYGVDGAAKKSIRHVQARMGPTQQVTPSVVYPPEAGEEEEPVDYAEIADDATEPPEIDSPPPAAGANEEGQRIA